MKKLYIVEGLPCSGKSTTSEYLANKAKITGNDVVYVDEGTGNHPADYEFHAFIEESSFIQFSKELQARIIEVGEKKLNGYIISLPQFPAEDIENLLRYKIYDSLPWETEMPLMLDKWSMFVNKAMKDNKIYVFNCVLLQNPMCETMMRFGFDETGSYNYISKIVEIIKPLEPTIIYLEGSEPAEKIKKTAGERGGWLDSVIDYHINSNYGKSIHAEGFDGYIACLRERQKRELDILGKLAIDQLVLKDADRNWDEAYNIIDNMILGAQSAEKSEGIMGSKAFDPNLI